MEIIETPYPLTRRCEGEKKPRAKINMPLIKAVIAEEGMLTRLEVNGFKNLVDFSLDFGPYTCIAGPNGVGKSNIFDAIQFLSLLTSYPINEAALQIRNSGEDTGYIEDLFFRGSDDKARRLEFAAEMIVDRKVSDDFGREAEANSTFLRYEVAFRFERPSAITGPLGGLVLEKETLRADYLWRCLASFEVSA